MQHAGGTSDDILNQVLKSSGDAHSQVTTLESKLHRLEAKSQTMGNIHIQVSTLEDKIQKMTTKCSEEIGSQLKGQIGNWIKAFLENRKQKVV